MVEDALSIVRAPKVGLWVVQKDTNGPFAEGSRVLFSPINSLPPSSLLF